MGLHGHAHTFFLKGGKARFGKLAERSSKIMWRKIRREDVQRGLVIRMSNMKDTPFNGAVIINMNGVEPTHTLGSVKVARPYAYATEHYDSNQPLLSSEVFDI